MPKVRGAPGCSLLGTQRLPRTSQCPQHRPPGSASPTDALQDVLAVSLRNGGYLYAFPGAAAEPVSCRKQSPAVFHLLLEEAPVFGQANRALSSPDSSGGVSQGRWHCPGPLAMAVLASSGPSPLLSGEVPLWGAERPLHAPSPQITLPKSPPHSLPAPGCTEKIQQCRMWPRSQGLLCPKFCTHKQSPKPKHRHQPLAQSRSLQEMAHVPLPWPFHRPSVCPCMARGCCLAFASCVLCHFVPGTPFLAGHGVAGIRVAWLSSYRCVRGSPGPRVLQTPQIQPLVLC